MIEVLGYISFDKPARACPLFLNLSQGSVTAAPGSEAV